MQEIIKKFNKIKKEVEEEVVQKNYKIRKLQMYLINLKDLKDKIKDHKGVLKQLYYQKKKGHKDMKKERKVIKQI